LRREGEIVSEEKSLRILLSLSPIGGMTDIAGRVLNSGKEGVLKEDIEPVRSALCPVRKLPCSYMRSTGRFLAEAFGLIWKYPLEYQPFV
jgi:hypothetical protein